MPGAPTERLALDEINRMNREGFVRSLGWIFEASPWVAEAVVDQRPFPDADALHRAMVRAVEAADPRRRLELIRAHPELGKRGPLSAASRAEQSGAGLRRGANRLRELTRRYRDRFGFPFVICVRDHTPEQILEAIDRRMDRSPEDEITEALRQIARIAWWRLREVVVDESKPWAV